MLKFWSRTSAGSLLVVTALSTGLCMANSNVHVTRHWHLHQPIYWPEWNTQNSQVNRYQFAWDSIQIKSQGGNMYPGSGVVHPQNVLVQGDPGEEGEVFTPDDRVNAYQHGPKDSLARITDMPNAGYSMSFSGSLQENVASLGRNNAYRYTANWNSHNTTARGWQTAGGNTRLDLVNFTYHHSFGPLIPKSVLRKEIQIFKEIWWKTWSGPSDKSGQSKGFWPSEAAFSRHMVDVLADEGIEWSIVANSHLSRTCANYFNVAGVGNTTANIDPPNRADQLGPSVPANQWWSGSLDGRGAWQAAPFAYQAHKVKYVNPETGAEKKITVVPMDDVLSYSIGYGALGTASIDAKIAPFATDPNRPSMVLLSTDGENAWGGGYTSWQEATPDLLHASAAKGYDVTTIQQFLDDHPVPDSAVVHIEDGSWFNAGNDWGSPLFLNWLNPPITMSGNGADQNPYTRFDFETPGWHVDFRNWAVLMAGANYIETAEQMWKDANGPESIQIWRIQEPYQQNGTYNNPNLVELGWHLFLSAFDSGFMYFGVWTDDEVKHTLAVNRTIEKVGGYVMGNLANDETPPTVFKPQRYPWNPGGKGWGENTKYQPVGFNGAAPFSSDFYIWTHVFDVSGVSNVTLRIRVDNDGVNTMANNQNETFAGGTDVGTWRSFSMNARTLPANDPSNNNQINFFMTPTAMAKYYFAKVNGYRGKLLDYYIEAVDGRGNIQKSDIQHVYVEDDGTPGEESSSVSFSSDPRDCSPLVVNYFSTHGPLEGVGPVYQQISFNGGTNWSRSLMSGNGVDSWTFTNNVPDNAPFCLVWFENTNGSIVDGNNGANWQISIRDCDAPSGPGTAVFSNAAACNPVMVEYRPNAGVLQLATQVYAHIGFNGWGMTRPGQVMTKISNNLWRITFIPTNDAGMLDIVFNNGAGNWDNNGGTDWHFALNPCEGPEILTGFSITNPALDLVVGETVSNYTLQGLAEGFDGHIIWTNLLSGTSGSVPGISPWTITGVSLQSGENDIVVSTSNHSVQVMITNAADHAGNAVYSDGWISTDQGGFGFGSWSLYTSSTNASQNGRFVSSGDGIQIGTPAWGLYANGGNLSEAKRAMPATLTTGRVIRVRLQNGFINPGSGVGVGLQNISGDTIWQFFFNGGDTNYNITGSTTDVAWTDNGIEIEFSLSSVSNYMAGITPVGGIKRFVTGSLESRADMAIQVFRAWNWNAGSGSDYDVFFNDLKITTSSQVAGAVTSDTVRITRTTGSLHDGIPITWWNQYGLGISSLATADPDGDGRNNYHEWIEDTNPTNSMSVYPSAVQFEGNGSVIQLHVGPPTSPDRLYDVYWSTNLLNPTWSRMNLNRIGSGNAVPLDITVTNDVPGRFYRTGVHLP